MITIKTHIAPGENADNLVDTLTRPQSGKSTAVAQTSAAATWHGSGALLDPRNRLTRQQQNVIALIAEGFVASEVANEMGISERTVQHHLSEARHKLGARNTTALVATALRLRMIA